MEASSSGRSMQADPSSSSSPSTAPGRGVQLKISQVFSACSFCKARKIKCDGVAPACGGCTKFGRAATCSLANDQHAHGRDYVTHLQRRIHKLRSEVNKALLVGPTAPTQAEDPLPSPSSRPGSGIPTKPAGSAPSSQQRPASAAIDSLVSDIGALPILASSYQSVSGDGPSLSTVVLTAALRSPMPLGSPPADLRQLLPDRATGEKLAHIYIDNVYPRLPFFSLQGFWAQFNQVYNASHHQTVPDKDVPSSTEPSGLNQGYSFFTVLLVLAIATSSLARSKDSVVSNHALQLFQSAMLFRDSAILPNSIIGVQSLLFLIQFSVLNPSVLDTWYLIGVGTRNCIDLGLHQDPPSASAINLTSSRTSTAANSVATSPSLLETRRRLWWSMYSFDRSTSLGYGRPTEIADNVITAQLPSFRIESAATEVQIEGYLQRYRALILQSRIYDALNAAPSPPAEDAPDATTAPQVIVADLARRLEFWRQRNPPGYQETLFESEWLMGRMLLCRPCPLIRERRPDELRELWSAAARFAAIYRGLVDENGIFYVQVGSEKAYWVGLALLYGYWKLGGDTGITTTASSSSSSSSTRRPASSDAVRAAVDDVAYCIRALGERWAGGRVLGEAFARISRRVAEVMGRAARFNGTVEAGDEGMPVEVVEFADYTSLTSIWLAGSEMTEEPLAFKKPSGSLRSLIRDITGD